MLPHTGLPIEGIVADVRSALHSPGCAVIVAPPGTGKTTVLPLRVLGEPWLGTATVLVLEPRRVATRAAARRMASMLGEPVGETVGYVTRDDRAVGERTRVQVVTEGVLTRRIQSDPSLEGVGMVVFDEIHERNLQTDLGLALALDVRSALRPDLRLAAMSATVESGRLAELIGLGTPAPVIEAEAGMFPVEIRWRPLPRRGSRRPGRAPQITDHVVRVVREAVTSAAGDLLVFLPGIREINDVAEKLDDLPAAVHRLHGSLPPDEQDAALAPGPFPKVVLATDIAESSLTVEGVSVVVDSGLARAPRFDSGTGMTRLRTVAVSRASADQRAGRAGRLGPGVCFRLWSKIEHGTRQEEIQPEITQVDLAALLLELGAWGQPDPRAMLFLDPPPQRSVDQARALLVALGLTDPNGSITAKGREAVRLPLHPRLARMVVDAPARDGRLATIVAALIDERDPATGPFDSLPVDLTARVEALAGMPSTVRLDRRRAQRVERVADDLARRARVGRETPTPHRTAEIVALAYPDRLAFRRGGPGRFRLRSGSTAWIPDRDPLATADFLIVVDIDGKRKNARIRSAAAIDRETVMRVFADRVDHDVDLTWSGRRIVERSTSSIGGVLLDEHEQRADPDERTLEMLLHRVASDGLETLPWGAEATSIRERVAHLRRTDETWPDLSDEALTVTLDQWLGPAVTWLTSLDELESLHFAGLVRGILGADNGRLDREAPMRMELPNGRTARIDYSGERPSISVRAQHLYGIRSTPRIGGEPITIEILSPADRPIQITSDLEHFWYGSWQEVRKDMAARYPKHDWPERP